MLVAYGNGVMTPLRLRPAHLPPARLRTERYHQPGRLTATSLRRGAAGFAYGYDLVGNILAIHDRTPASGILNNPAASDQRSAGAVAGSGDALVRQFDYDPLYRLLSATGRECDQPPD